MVGMISGFCSGGALHARCRLEGCACACHVQAAPPERLKVALKCLTGNHDACRYHDTADVAHDGSTRCGCPHPSHVATDDTLTAEPDELEPPGEQIAIATPIHNHSWEPAPDVPDGSNYQGKVYRCACGATMDSTRVYPPLAGIPVTIDDTVPVDTFELRDAGEVLARVDLSTDPHMWPAAAGRQAGKATAAFEGLTDDEKRQVVAAHLVMAPDAALEAVRLIVAARLAAQGG